MGEGVKGGGLGEGEGVGGISSTLPCTVSPHGASPLKGLRTMIQQSIAEGGVDGWGVGGWSPSLTAEQHAHVKRFLLGDLRRVQVQRKALWKEILWTAISP